MSTKIYDFINSTNYKDRNKEVISLINTYFKNNTESLSDGIINHFIVFGNTNRNRFYEVYNIDHKSYLQFKKQNQGLIKNKAVDDLLYLALFCSYCDTKDPIFLDMLAIVEIGSKFKKYFKHGISNSAKMKWVIENGLSKKFLIKKYGSYFLTTQAQIRTIINSPTTVNRFKKPELDDNINFIISRISTTINSALKNISDVYYKTKDDVIFTQSELNSGDDSSVSLNNNSIMIDNIKTLVYNYDPTYIDYKLLTALRIKSTIKKSIFKEIFKNREKRYFYRIAYIYLDYYTNNFSNDINDIKKGFISKSTNARMKSQEMAMIEKDLENDIKNYITEYQKIDDKIDDLSSISGRVNLVRSIKYYVIFKTREMMNHL